MDFRQLRYNRTRASNRVKETMQYMLTSPAQFSQPNGLPSWWPFWSDVLVNNVRDAVRAARYLAEAEECHEKPHKRPQRCGLCGAFYPLFPEGSNKVTCGRCGVEWLRG